MTFFTTKHINELIKDEYIAFINKYYIDILENPNKYITLAEKKISKYLWWGYVKLLNSWTTALQFWLLSLWVGEWDEVILPANTYSATAIAITNIWAKPVFCDINLNNYTIDIADIENKISSKTKVIIPVHIYWYSCYMDDINNIAKKYNLKILEDASHAFWWEYRWQKLWTIWDVWAFSCHSSKNFWTFWNGGFFYTKEKKLLDKINNYIYPDIQDKEVLKSLRTPANIWWFDAIVLLLKLRYVDKIIDSNIILFKQYIEKLVEDPNVINLPEIVDNSHIRNFVCLVKNREKLLEESKWKIYYDINLSESIVFKDKSVKNNLQNTKFFFDNSFSFNFYFWKKLI